MKARTNHASCASCGSDSLMTVTFDAAANRVLFRVCSHCETKWWEADGASVDLSSVLPFVAR